MKLLIIKNVVNIGYYYENHNDNTVNCDVTLPIGDNIYKILLINVKKENELHENMNKCNINTMYDSIFSNIDDKNTGQKIMDIKNMITSRMIAITKENTVREIKITRTNKIILDKLHYMQNINRLYIHSGTGNTYDSITTDICKLYTIDIMYAITDVNETQLKNIINMDIIEEINEKIANGINEIISTRFNMFDMQKYNKNEVSFNIYNENTKMYITPLFAEKDLSLCSDKINKTNYDEKHIKIISSLQNEEISVIE